MPTFDIISEVDIHELTNAVDQASREIGTRFDFRGADACFELAESVVTMTAQSEFQIDQMLEILKGKMIKRQIDISCIKLDDIVLMGKKAIQNVTVQQGIEADIGRKIVKHVKDLKMKVQIAIQGDKLRVTGKKRDDLQDVMAVLRKGEFECHCNMTTFEIEFGRLIFRRLLRSYKVHCRAQRLLFFAYKSHDAANEPWS